ncbi:helix-turn-helix domain-containing protein [Nonomuraea aridisoli]|nr:hypothetical protein [Nonomuraea aridisoli]
MNLSILKYNRAKAIQFSTLSKICSAASPNLDAVGQEHRPGLAAVSR